MRRLLLVYAILASCVASHAATITFSGTVTGSTTAPYTEAGFTASVLSGAVFYNRGSIGKYAGGDELAPGGGVLGITATNGSPFTFSGLYYSPFFYSETYTGFPGTETLVVQGYRSSLLVATQTYTETDRSDYSFTPEAAGALSGLTLDQLRVDLQGGMSSDHETLFSENATFINVNPVAAPITVTPEPSSLALLATGALSIARLLRRRRGCE